MQLLPLEELIYGKVPPTRRPLFMRFCTEGTDEPLDGTDVGTYRAGPLRKSRRRDRS